MKTKIASVGNKRIKHVNNDSYSLVLNFIQTCEELEHDLFSTARRSALICKGTEAGTYECTITRKQIVKVTDHWLSCQLVN